MTPYDTQSGVIIHAQAYETMAHGQFLVPVSNKSVIGICMLDSRARRVHLCLHKRRARLSVRRVF